VSGHIKKRKSELTGKVTYQCRIPGEPAKTFDRKRDATRWLEEEQARRVRGETRDSQAPFRELVATWERTRAAKLAPKTRERYASVTRKYLLPEWGSTPLRKLDRPTIKQWFADLGEEGCSAGTAKKIHTVLSSILDEGVELRMLRSNPAARLRVQAPERRDMTILTATEVRTLADSLPRAQDKLAVYVAAYTGLRAGELWALQRRDVDVAHRRLLVERTLTSESGRLIFRNVTKTDGSRRVVSLPTFLANMLRTHLATLPADPQAIPADPQTLLFTAPSGGNGRSEADPTNPVRHELFMARVFRPAVRGKPAKGKRPAVPAVLPPRLAKLRFHDLRHTCASFLIHSGASVLLVAKRLGHTDPSMTLKVYGHLYPSHEAALADALDATFNGADNVERFRRDEAA
jgi:integrase